jgi:hypothetical protein
MRSAGLTRLYCSLCYNGKFQLLGDKLDLDEIFDNMDMDRNGSVCGILPSLRYAPPPSPLSAHVLASLQISFRELLVWLGVYLKGSEEEKLKHIFNAFDQDGNKVLDHSEITNVLMVRMSPEPNAPTTSKRSVERTYRSSRGLPLYT